MNSQSNTETQTTKVIKNYLREDISAFMGMTFGVSNIRPSFTSHVLNDLKDESCKSLDFQAEGLE